MTGELLGVVAWKELIDPIILFFRLVMAKEFVGFAMPEKRVKLVSSNVCGNKEIVRLAAS